MTAVCGAIQNWWARELGAHSRAQLALPTLRAIADINLMAGGPGVFPGARRSRD
jgi:hypothetical protein